jgi:hypothetical protein
MKLLIMKNILLFLLTLQSLSSFCQNQNISNGNVFDGEPYIAINPNNSKHLVVAWMGWINLSNQFKIKTKTSFDGGLSWSNTIELPHTVPSYSSADPSIDFNNNGKVFICYIDFTGTTPPVTGGVYICKSNDSGISWSIPNEVISTNYDGTKWPIDRPWMVIDKSTGPNQGNIYVTSMNLNRNNPPYNPYLSVSSDNGNTFSKRYIDTVNWKAGSLNPLPMCFPTVTSSGVLCAIYPSYVITQSLYTQSLIAKSTSAGNNFNYNIVNTFTDSILPNSYPSAKKGGILISNPSDSNQLANIFLRAIHGDLDVFITESFNLGNTWTAPIRVNDDPIGNNKMQDLIWADFDLDGDLVISWRDRRNGNDSTFKSSSEIWATYRDKDSINFNPNFQVSSQSVLYDSILESAGNDFMSIKLQDDTLNAVWGDTRNGKLNIWFQRMISNGNVVSIKKISSVKIPQVFVYPNPTSSLITILAEGFKKVTVYDINGKKILSKTNNIINLEKYPNNTYIIEITTQSGTITKKILKQ